MWHIIMIINSLKSYSWTLNFGLSGAADQMQPYTIRLKGSIEPPLNKHYTSNQRCFSAGQAS